MNRAFMFDPANEPAVPIDLPGIYDTFDEARRASFVNAMNYKQEGGKLCGYLCSYGPLELVDARERARWARAA